ncbi:MAG: hypothetical protein L6Q29_04405 [Candidatus Pacebacteria bacterium]|nr:hypothetical protein [Candidatus Paceibacterota bacterium]
MITKEEFMRTKKGDIILREPHRGYGFNRLKFVAVGDYSNGTVPVDFFGSRSSNDNDIWGHLKFEDSNDWYLNPSTDDEKRLKREILIEITCPCCKGVFKKSEADMEWLDELTSDKVGYRIA